MEHTSQQRVRCAEHSTKREMAVRARLRARSENSCDRERLNHHDSVVFGKALDVRFWDFRTDSGQAITCEIGLRSLSGGGRPILLSQYPHGHVLSLDILSPDTWTPGCRDGARQGRRVAQSPPAQNLEIPLISGQEVAKRTFGAIGQSLIYEGAGSRIRTDDLLITNQLLYQLSYAGKNAPETSATFGV